ncbi:NAD(P)-binding protein [Lentinus tigrinus ALCF2SS1-7]|uniref:NAD(P)-binding protein n=1 Tax=Lentinus tigrinus ALCF2SS1-7 TaxID=1328758 RepID=UPI001165CA54|nr:NAD(P)-binding protein [Lentinus tigrinus ALCF2SS1-7]
MASLWNQYFSPRGEWSVDDVPDQSGKVFLITGGTSGLGFATAKVLLARNARVYITSRGHEKGRQAVNELRRISEAIYVLQMDLSDLYSVQKAAYEFVSKEQYLHCLINNAGVMAPPIALLTRQQYDLQFGVNVIGHFYLTQLLLPVLLGTAKVTAQKVRVLNYTSSAPPAPRIDYTTLMDGPVRRRYTPAQLYRQSKLGCLLLAQELAEQYGEQGIVSIAINPGNVRTNLNRYSGGVFGSLWDMFSTHVSKGILTPLFAATHPKAESLNGKILHAFGRVDTIPDTVTERCAQETLWDWLEAQMECFDRTISPPHSAGLRADSLDVVTMYSSQVKLI